MSALIEDEKQVVDRFYNSLLKIEKKRQEYSKSILRKYYKILHKISFLLPYEIQVYLENEILVRVTEHQNMHIVVNLFIISTNPAF